MNRGFKVSLIAVVAVSILASAAPVFADAICPNSEPKIFANGQVTTIPDNNPAGASVSIVVPDNDPACPSIWDLNVGVRIRHTWQGDLRLTLSHVESGQSLVLMDRPGVPQSTFGFSADNLGNVTTGDLFIFDDEAANIYDLPAVASPGITNVSGAWRPENSLSLFDQKPKAGTWVLSVVDNAAGDTGAIERFELHFVNKIPEPATLGLLGFGALLLVRRRAR